MITVRDDDKEATFVNPEHIISVEYCKPRPILSIPAKLVIMTIRNEMIYDGELATTVYKHMTAA